MNFATSLREEFNHDHYITCIRDGRVEIYYGLYFLAPNPKIVLLFDQSGNDKNICSLWESELTDEKILKHMEDEVGVDASGFDSFAGYFCDAILAKPSVERDLAYFPENPNAKVCAIRLSYNLGGMNLEGSLQFQLIQSDLDKRILELFRWNYNTEKQNQITPTTRATRPKKTKLSRVVVSKESSGNNGGKEDGNKKDGEEDEDETVVKAKKRKVGGVSIFPGKKK